MALNSPIVPGFGAEISAPMCQVVKWSFGTIPKEEGRPHSETSRSDTLTTQSSAPSAEPSRARSAREMGWISGMPCWGRT